MARISAKVNNWKPQRGKGKCIMDTYYAIQGNKDTLCDIMYTHKSWGKDWYDMASIGAYEDAKQMLIANKKANGECLLVAINCINDLMHLEEEMKAYDKKGGNN